MTEQKFESKFHKQYVGGEGEVVEASVRQTPNMTEVKTETFEEILAQYRAYVNDPKAELPEEILEELKKLGKI